MAERLPPGAPAGDESAPPRGGVPEGTPRWVKVFALVTAILFAVFVFVHLTGHQLGGHLPSHSHHAHASGTGEP